MGITDKIKSAVTGKATTSDGYPSLAAMFEGKVEPAELRRVFDLLTASLVRGTSIKAGERFAVVMCGESVRPEPHLAMRSVDSNVEKITAREGANFSVTMKQSVGEGLRWDRRTPRFPHLLEKWVRVAGRAFVVAQFVGGDDRPTLRVLAEQPDGSWSVLDDSPTPEFLAQQAEERAAEERKRTSTVTRREAAIMRMTADRGLLYDLARKMGLVDEDGNRVS